MRAPAWPFVAVLLLSPACDDTGFIAGDASLPALDAGIRDAGTPDAARPPEELQAFVEWQMRAGGIRGLAAAMIPPDGGETRFVLAGEASEGVPVDEHTLFTMASVSKTFAGVVAMQLVEEGLLDLDAPIERYLGRPATHPDAPGEPITTRMLLCHVSGLIDDWPLLGSFTTSETDPDATPSEFAEAYLAETDHYAATPLERYEYANAGYGILGAVLEAAAGEDLRARSQRTLFAPLALDGAGWFLADVDRGRLATAYSYSELTGEYAPLVQNGFAFYPASSLRISVTGLARFLRMFAGGGELDGVRALEAASVEEMRRVQYEALDADQGLAFTWSRRAGARWIGHSGAGFGISTQMLLREDGLGVIVLTNSDAYIRARVGQRSGSEAISAILERLASSL